MARETQTQEAGAQRERRATQRERLIGGMVDAATELGCAGANVSAVIERAGVSRPTFYEYFDDRDACFLATLETVSGRLLEKVRAHVGESPPERAMHASIEVLVAFAVESRSAARFLTNESLGAGPTMLAARDDGVRKLAAVIDRAQRKAEPAATVPDVAALTVMGGAYRLLGARLRRGEPGLSRLREDLLVWLDTFAAPAAKHRWGSLGAGVAEDRSPFVAETAMRAPAMLGPGRPRIAPEEVAENQRLRVLHATATLAARDGYAATKVSDILKLAGVDGRAFYSRFAGKQEAFMAVHEIGVQQVLWVTGEAFFSAESWPERVWEASRAFVQFLELNPVVARVGFVEAYAVGPAAVQRVEDSHFSFTMFLQEGYQHAPETQLSRLSLEASVMCIFELVYRRARARRTPPTGELIAQMSFLCLAPFLGAEAAGEFIERQR